MNFDCIGIGIISLDHLCVVERYPESNTKNKVVAYDQQGGGPVPTALATLGRLRKRVALVAKTGIDAEAEFLKRELESFNVSTAFLVQSSGNSTPKAFVIIDRRNGHRTVFLYREKSADLTVRDIDLSVIGHCKIIHLDGHEIDVALACAHYARKHRVKVSIDIGSARAVPAELLKLADYAIVSNSFANAFLVKDDPAGSAGKLLEYGLRMAGVTCGRDGSYFAAGNKVFHQPAFNIRAVDTTGAGDVFHGAALYGLLQNFSPQQVAVFATAAAALKCTKVGGKAGIPDLEMITTFLRQQGIDTHFIEEANNQ